MNVGTFLLSLRKAWHPICFVHYSIQKKLSRRFSTGTVEICRFNSLRPNWNAWHFAGDICNYNFFYENYNYFILISPKFVPKGSIDIKSPLLQAMDWRQTESKSCWSRSATQIVSPGGWFNIKMSSYQYRKFHCGDKRNLRLFHLHNGISYTCIYLSISLYCIKAQGTMRLCSAKRAPVLSVLTISVCMDLQLTWK